MLREGWDVPEVGVILLLRKFGSPVYGQQVIGRAIDPCHTTLVADGVTRTIDQIEHFVAIS